MPILRCVDHTWDDETSTLLFSMDDELQRICNSLDRLDLTAVPSLKDYYGRHTVNGFTQKMRSIPAFHGMRAPMVRRGDGRHPDFSSRFFRADIEHGLQSMREVGRRCGVDTPSMDTVLDWYRGLTGRSPAMIWDGMTAERLCAFYEGAPA